MKSSHKKFGSRSEYKWNDWFQKKKVILKKGKDFSVEVYSMLGNIRNAATRHRKSISVKVEGDSVTILVRGNLP